MDTEDPVAPPPDEPTDDTVTPKKIGSYTVEITVRGDGNLEAPTIGTVETAVEEGISEYYADGEVTVNARATRTDR